MKWSAIIMLTAGWTNTSTVSDGRATRDAGEALNSVAINKKVKWIGMFFSIGMYVLRDVLRVTDV